MNQSFKVLTFNIHKGMNVFGTKTVLEMIKASIIQTHSDIVLLQEVRGQHQSTQSQFETLADQAWNHFSYGQNAVYESGNHGNAILSNFPILSFHNLVLTSNWVEKRGALHARVQFQGLPNSPIHLVSLHLSLFQTVRSAQIKRLFQYIYENIQQNEPLIIAGDFNDWSKVANDQFKTQLGMEEAFSLIHGRNQNTFPSLFPILALDRIYFRNLELIKAQVPVIENSKWQDLSDHIPLSAEFRIKSQ